MNVIHHFLLKDQHYEVSVDFNRHRSLIAHISENVAYILAEKKIYHVESDVRDETFQKFLNYWLKEEIPDMNIDDLFEYYLLYQEFGIMSDYLFNSDKENELHVSCLHCITRNDKSLNKSLHEEYIAKHLQIYINNYPKLLRKVPISSLYNIFFHKERFLNDQVKAYIFIIDSINLSKSSPEEPNMDSFYILLESLDEKELNQEILLDSLINMKEHMRFCPKISFSDFLTSDSGQLIKIESFSVSDNQRLEKEIEKLKTEKQNNQETFDKQLLLMNERNLELFTENQRIKKEFEEFKKQKENEIKKLKEENQQINNMKSTNQEYCDKEIANLKIENQKYKEEIESFQNQNNKEIDFLNSEKQKLFLENQLLNSIQKQNSIEIENLKNEIQKLEEEKRKLKDSYENQIEKLNSKNKLNEEVKQISQSQFEKEIENLKIEKQRLEELNSINQKLSEKEINHLKAENQRLEEYKAIIVSQNEKEIDNLKSENERLKEDKKITQEQHEKEINFLKSEKQRIEEVNESNISKSEVKITYLIKDNTDLQNKINTMKIEYNNDLKTLQNKIENLIISNNKLAENTIIEIDKYRNEIYHLECKIQRYEEKKEEGAKSPVHHMKKLSINVFNSLQLEEQHLFVERIIKDLKLKRNVIKFYSSTIYYISELLKYFVDLDKSNITTDDFHFFNIKTNDDKKLFENMEEIEKDVNVIKVLYSAVEFLFSKKLLESDKFLSYLKCFSQRVSIEVKYPSDLFNKVFEQVLNIKKNYDNLRISVAVSGIYKTDSTFQNNKKISYLNIKNVKLIGDGSFSGCSSLIQVSISEIVTEIGLSAFLDCKSLMFIKIPFSVTSIGTFAFCGCSSLKNLKISSPISSLSESTFERCSKLTQIEIPDSVKSIGERVFAECTSLSIITIPNSVTSIGDKAFYKCTSLNKVEIPDSVDSIGRKCFFMCRSLTEVKLSESLKIIDESTFEGCSLLNKINFPNSVTVIESRAFFNCLSLDNLITSSNIQSIAHDAFLSDK